MIRRIAIAAALAAALPAAASDFGSIGSLTQDEFRRISEDLGAAFSYKGLTPATPLGIMGFDVGLEVSDTRVENSSLFQRAGGGDRSDIVVPKFHVYKGLGGGFDIGAFVGGSSQLRATLLGMEGRYAFLDDTLTTPALGLRLSGTYATGTGDLSFGTGALDVIVSKKFAALTPYAGAGAVYVRSRATNTTLSDESFARGRVFAGVNLNLVAMNMAFEAEKMGDNTTLAAKFGFRF